MSAVVNYGVALAKISLKAFRRPGGGMSPNRGVYFQKARSPARLRVSVAAQLAADNARTVKMRAGEMSVWNISPPWRAFPCGKNGISLLKEISFLPQRRKFLAAKKFSGVCKSGKNGASGGSFSSNWWPSACQIPLSVCKPFPSRADAGKAAVRTASRGGRQSVAGIRLPDFILHFRNHTRIAYFRPSPSLRPSARFSRGRF